MQTSGPRFAASFDERAWSEDVAASYGEGSRARAAAVDARRQFERQGVPASTLQACEEDGRDRTRLGNAVKTYLPLSAGPASSRPFGMLFMPVLRNGRLELDFLAFGVRHHPRESRAPTVYAIAHRRLHGRWP